MTSSDGVLFTHTGYSEDDVRGDLRGLLAFEILHRMSASLSRNLR